MSSGLFKCPNLFEPQETRPAVELDMHSGWFNSSETVRTIAQHKKPDLWWKLTYVRGGSTLPNLFELQETRPAVELDMHSGWFNSSETVRTIAQHTKPDLWLKLTWVRGSSTLPNLFEPLSSRGNKDHRIISHVWVNAPIWYRNSYLYLEHDMNNSFWCNEVTKSP